MGPQTAKGKRCFLVAVGAGGTNDDDFNLCGHYYFFSPKPSLY